MLSGDNGFLVLELGKRRVGGLSSVRPAGIRRASPGPGFRLRLRARTAPTAGYVGSGTPKLRAGKSHSKDADEDDDGDEHQCEHECRCLQVKGEARHFPYAIRLGERMLGR